MSESLSEDGFSLIYFSWKYLNICYARGRNKERGIARVRTVQLGPAPGAVNLSRGSLVTGRCLLENDTCRAQADVLCLPIRTARPSPRREGLWGVGRSRTHGALDTLTECKCFQWQMKRGW